MQINTVDIDNAFQIQLRQGPLFRVDDGPHQLIFSGGSQVFATGLL
jgi:hypothetical protein